MKDIIFRTCFFFYNWLPLKVRVKFHIADFIFKCFGFIFRGWPFYEHWKKRKDISFQELKPLYLHDINYIETNQIHLSNASDPIVSIIIPTFGKPNFTKACLASISDSEPNCPYEVIIVDDASCVPGMEEIKSIEGLRFIENPKNIGFGRTCNKGAAMASGEFLYFLNNDTEVTRGWLEAMLTLCRQPGVGAVGSKLVYPDGCLQEAGGIVWKDGSVWIYGNRDDPMASEYNFVRPVDYCSAASLLISQKLFSELGGFDDLFSPAYCEDTDLAFRIREAGYTVMYQPESVVFHYEGASYGKDVSTGPKSYQVTNQKKFYKRWKRILQQYHKAPGNDFCVVRSRPYNEKVLVVDHYVPQFDKDAGSRTLLQFVKVLIRLGFSIDLWPQNMRFDPNYTPTFQQMGVHVFYDFARHGDFDTLAKHNSHLYKYVLVSRPMVANDIVNSLNKYFGNSRIVYYGHDIHHLRLEKQHEVAGDFLAMVEAKKMKKIEHKLWQQFDVIMYPSQSEVDLVDNFLGRKKSLRVPVSYYDVDSATPIKGPEERSGIIFVAGFNHDPNVDAAQWFTKEIFPLVSDKYPKLKLYLVGSEPAEAVLKLQSDRVIVTGYVSDEALASFYANAQVAVIPLRFGAGVKGKVLEALSKGVPVVTTDYGVQGVPELRDEILLANAPDQFAKHVCMILQNEALWTDLSQRGLRFIDKHFSFQTMSSVLAQAFGLSD